MCDPCVPGKLLNRRYRVIESCGSGSFGQVLHCSDRKTGGSVAIKVAACAESLQREYELMKDIEDAENWSAEESGCVRALDLFLPSPATLARRRGPRQQAPLCGLVMEKLGDSLVSVLKTNGFTPLPLPLIRTVMRQVLRSLHFLHTECGLLHLDLKPHNIVTRGKRSITRVVTCADGAARCQRLPASLEVRLIDFGGSLYADDGEEGGYSYTTEFRAPEVILEQPVSGGSDMWSFACVLFQLYSGQLLFRTPHLPTPTGGGTQRQMSGAEQLALIVRCLGGEEVPRDVALQALNAALYRRYPGDDDCDSGGDCDDGSSDDGGGGASAEHLFDAFGRRLPVPSVDGRRVPLSECGGGSAQYRPLPPALAHGRVAAEHSALLHLLTWCLQWRPQDRPSAAQALAHPFWTSDVMPSSPPQPCSSPIPSDGAAAAAAAAAAAEAEAEAQAVAVLATRCSPSFPVAVPAPAPALSLSPWQQALFDPSLITLTPAACAAVSVMPVDMDTSPTTAWRESPPPPPLPPAPLPLPSSSGGSEPAISIVDDAGFYSLLPPMRLPHEESARPPPPATSVNSSFVLPGCVPGPSPHASLL